MTYESRLTGTSRFARIVLVGRHNVVLARRNIMAATWNKIDPVKVTFTVEFTEKTDRGLLKFEDTVEGDVAGYTLQYGNRGAYFLGPKDAPATLDAVFENLPAAERAAIAKIIEGALTKPAPKRKPKSS